MLGMKRDLVEGYNGEDWDVGPAGTIMCPCGHRIEDDGKCPNGHRSPLLQEGLI